MRLRLKTLGLMAALATSTALPAFAQDGEVTIALRVAVNTLDPHMTATVGSDLSVLSHIYPALILRGPDLKLQPALAESWEAVDDNTWRFNLVEGAKFENGEPLDAETVKWNLERVRNPDVGARIAGWFSLISDVTVVDPTTVEVTTSEPYPALADQLSMFFLLPPKWTESHNPATETMSGSRYEVAENVPGDHITLKANPDYWGETPAFGTVVFRTIPEIGSRTAALMAGEVDLITGIPTAEIARIDEAENASAGAVPSTRSMLIKFNHQKPPMDNEKFRQAVNYAIDKEGIVEAIFDGEAEVSQCEILSEDYFGFNPDLTPYAYDPEKATELLKESGVDLSQPIEIEVPIARYLNGEEVTQAIAAMLQDVGLTMKISEIEFGAFMQKQIKARDLAQMAVQGLAWPTIDADGMLTMFAPGNVYDYWNNAEFGALLDKARATTDQTQRQELYVEATKLMCDTAGAGFLYVQPQTYGVSDKVTWQARGDDWVRAFDMAPKS